MLSYSMGYSPTIRVSTASCYGYAHHRSALADVAASWPWLVMVGGILLTMAAKAVIR